MSKIVEHLRDRITRRETQIRELGAELLPLILNQARDLQKLRQKSKDWAGDLKEIKMEARVASRYLMLADHWETPPGREVMKRLPADVQKLEWLCRLKPADLDKLSTEKDLIRSDRTTVINEVKQLTKVPVVRKPITLDAVKKTWKAFRKNALPSLLELPPEDQQKFFADLEATLPQFRKDVFEEEDGEDMEADETRENGSSGQDEASEEPAEDEQAKEGEPGEGTQAEAQAPEVPRELRPETVAEAAKSAKTPEGGKQKEANKPAAKREQTAGRR